MIRFNMFLVFFVCALFLSCAPKQTIQDKKAEEVSNNDYSPTKQEKEISYYMICPPRVIDSLIGVATSVELNYFPPSTNTITLTDGNVRFVHTMFDYSMRVEMDKGCKSFGLLTVINGTDVIAEGYIYLTQACQYVLWKYKGQTYANTLSNSAKDFLLNSSK